MTFRTLLFLAVIISTLGSPVSASEQAPPSVIRAPGTAIQAPAPARDAPARTTGTSGIRGRVTGADGSPLPRATVRITSSDVPEVRTASTDANGRYEFHNLPPARYGVYVSRTGFIGTGYGQRRPDELAKPLDVPEDTVIDQIDFRLVRAGVIAGRVLDEFGEPIANASVQALQLRMVNGEQQTVSTNPPFSTPDTGEFRLWNLLPGDYYVLVSLRFNQPRETGDKNLGYIPMYFPGTAAVAEAQPVHLAAGESAGGIEVTLTPTPTARVTGSVIDARGQTLRSGYVSAVRRSAASIYGGGPLNNGSNIGADGTFSITGLAPGDYDLRSTAMPTTPGKWPDTMTATVTITSEDVSGVLLTPVIPVRVSGHVTLDPPSTAIEASIVRVNAYPRDQQNMFFNGIGAPPVVKDDFTFELFTSPGRVNIGAYLMNVRGWSIKAVLVGGDDVTRGGVDLLSGRDLDDVEIVLTNRVQIVSGTITNARAEAVPDARVVVFSQNRDDWQGPNQSVGLARPDQNGRFTVRTLRPGDYFAVALPFVNEPGSQSGANYYEGLSTSATRFTLREGQTTTVDLKLTEPR